VNPDETNLQPSKHLVPTWAILGASDFWVDRLSARIGLPTSRTKTVHGSHTAIVKPGGKSSDVYRFVKEKIRFLPSSVFCGTWSRNSDSYQRTADAFGCDSCRWCLPGSSHWEQLEFVYGAGDHEKCVNRLVWTDGLVELRHLAQKRHRPARSANTRPTRQFGPCST
jgi:hypothetical protein